MISQGIALYRCKYGIDGKRGIGGRREFRLNFFARVRCGSTIEESCERDWFAFDPIGESAGLFCKSDRLCPDLVRERTNFSSDRGRETIDWSQERGKDWVGVRRGLRSRSVYTHEAVLKKSKVSGAGCTIDWTGRRGCQRIGNSGSKLAFGIKAINESRIKRYTLDAGDRSGTQTRSN